MTRNICIVCGREAIPRMGKWPEYWFCEYCHLGWIRKNPKNNYSENYYVSGSSLLAKAFSPVEKIFFRIRQGYVDEKTINLWIDVGAGEGNFLTSVAAKKKFGVEVSAAGRKKMEERGLAVMTDKEFLSARNLQADVISFWHVLEHVDDPQKYLEAAKGNLVSDGSVAIAVPNIDSWEFALFGKNWFHLAPGFHRWYFSPRALKLLLEKADLKVKKIDYWAVEHHLTGILQSFINYSTRTDNVLHKMVRRKQDFQKINVTQMLWILFWCSLGLPIVVGLWMFGAIARRPGAFVLVASRS